MAWIAAVVGAGASIFGASQSAKGAKEGARSRKAAGFLNVEVMKTQLASIQRLNQMADKLEAGEGISAAEKQFLDSTFEQATEDITEARTETTKSALDTLASVGFLRSGRTARTVRRINIEAGREFARIGLERERSRLGAVERNRDRILNIRSAVAGSGARVQPIDTLSGSAIRGAGLQALGGSFLQLGGQLSRNEQLEKQLALQQSKQATQEEPSATTP